jgi:hypothetical protein
MKTLKAILCLFGILPALFLGLLWQEANASQEGVTDIIKNATSPYHDDTLAESIVAPKNTVVVNQKYQGGKFLTETRKDQISRFKCSQCHNNKKEVTVTNASEMAHGAIALDHGGKEKPLSCFTCHSEENRDVLVTEAGIKIDMDHSYQMCGQCHFRQKKDWVGGAHGKRVTYWAGTRVVKSCTSCHDPHMPLFKKRWPSTYSRPFK